MLPRVAALLLVILGACAGLAAGRPVDPAGASSEAGPVTRPAQHPARPAANRAVSTRAPRHDLPGWKLAFVDDFSGRTLGPAWFGYGGHPGGDPEGLFATSHLRVGHGVLRIAGYRDPRYGGTFTT